MVVVIHRKQKTFLQSINTDRLTNKNKYWGFYSHYKIIFLIKISLIIKNVLFHLFQYWFLPNLLLNLLKHLIQIYLNGKCWAISKHQVPERLMYVSFCLVLYDCCYHVVLKNSLLFCHCHFPFVFKSYVLCFQCLLSDVHSPILIRYIWKQALSFVIQEVYGPVPGGHRKTQFSILILCRVYLT